MTDFQFETGPSMRVERYYGFYNIYTPHFFVKDGKRLFLAYEIMPNDAFEKIPNDAKLLENWVPNLSIQMHRKSVRNIEKYKAQLRENGGRFIATDSIHDDPYRLLDWVRLNRFTFEVHGNLVSELRIPDYEPVPCFHGSLVEYAASFNYRIYDPDTLQSIVNLTSKMPQMLLE